MSEGKFKKRIRRLWDPKVIDGELVYLEDVVSPKGVEEILDEAKNHLDKVIAEIEKNATEDTLFERMVLVRLKNYRKTWFGEK